MVSARPRDRILITATELFRKEGIAAVGVNRIINEADVAPMTLYRQFGSKDGLYLRESRPNNLLRWDVEVAPGENGENLQLNAFGFEPRLLTHRFHPFLLFGSDGAVGHATRCQ